MVATVAAECLGVGVEALASWLSAAVLPIPRIYIFPLSPKETYADKGTLKYCNELELSGA